MMMSNEEFADLLASVQAFFAFAVTHQETGADGMTLTYSGANLEERQDELAAPLLGYLPALLREMDFLRKQHVQAREILAELGAADPAVQAIYQGTGDAVTMTVLVPGSVWRKARAWLDKETIEIDL